MDVVVVVAEGAEARVALHGATVLSFRTAAGTDALFVSAEAVMNGVKPIRGGIPLVFPQFGGGACSRPRAVAGCLPR
jgi:glucose-6-phosphate 1-epimerase